MELNVEQKRNRNIYIYNIHNMDENVTSISPQKYHHSPITYLLDDVPISCAFFLAITQLSAQRLDFMREIVAFLLPFGSLLFQQFAGAFLLLVRSIDLCLVNNV